MHNKEPCDRCVGDDDCTLCFEDIKDGKFEFSYFRPDWPAVLLLWLALGTLLLSAAELGQGGSWNTMLYGGGITAVLVAAALGWYYTHPSKKKKPTIAQTSNDRQEGDGW